MNRILQVIYTPRGEVTTDDGVSAYIDSVIAILEEFPERSAFTFLVGTEILITAFRAAVKQGRIPEDVEVTVYNEEGWRFSRIDRDGRFADPSQIVPERSVNDELMEALF